MRREQITIAHLTPALGQLLVQGSYAAASLLALRYAFFVGDVPAPCLLEPPVPSTAIVNAAKNRCEQRKGALDPRSVAGSNAHDYAGSAGFQPAGGEGTKSPLDPRSVHAWASPTSRLEAGAPSAICFVEELTS